MVDKIENGALTYSCCSYSIVALSETGLSKNMYNFVGSELENYEIIADDKVYASHGLCVLVSSLFKDLVKQVKNCKSSNVLWLEIDKAVLGFKFIMGCVYIPPESSCFFDLSIFEDIYFDITSFELPVCMLGDFNSRVGQLSDLPSNDMLDKIFDIPNQLNDVLLHLSKNDIVFDRFSVDFKVNNSGHAFIEFLCSLGLTIANGRFGEKTGCFTNFSYNGGCSLIDYAILSPQLYDVCNNFRVLDYDPLTSNTHCAITLDFNRYMYVDDFLDPDFPHKEDVVDNVDFDGGIDNSTVYKSYVFKWDAVSGYEYGKSLEDLEFGKVMELALHCNICKEDPTQENVDSLFKSLSDVLIDKAKDCGICRDRVSASNINSGSCNKRDKPWFDGECRYARSDYYRVRNKLKFICPLERVTKIRLASKRYKNILKKKKAEYFKALHKKLRNLRSNNSKDYWNFLMNHGKKGQTLSPIELEVFKLHFQKISNKDHSDVGEFDLNSADVSVNEELNFEFTADEVALLIKKLKSGKACGLDHIRNEMLKSCSPNLLSIFASLFNIVLNTGIIPEEWCIGYIMPLYKNKGSINDPDNYRGITLLSCVGKLFSALLNERITRYLDAVGGIGDEQAGFRQGHSTVDHIFALHAILSIYLSAGKRVYCAFIDYKKAFDFVDRVSLWNKLLSSGVNGKLLVVIHIMYLNAKSCVKVDDKISDFFNCNVGVRQGENLSPLLFSIFLNDFEFSVSRKYNGLSFLSGEISDCLNDDDVEHFLKIYVLLYADDTIVLSESAEELQKALNAVYDYCNNWKLTVNISKTKVVIFSNGKVTKFPAFLFGHDIVEVVSEYVYLGVKFFYNASFLPSINKQVSQARRAYFALMSKIRSLRLPVDLSIELFHQLVLPILLYGCEVWGYSDIERIEVFYRKFLKNILQVCANTPTCIVHGETGTMPVLSHVLSRMLTYYARLCNGKQSKLSYILYKVLRKKHEGDSDFFSPWIDIVKSWFCHLGMRDFWVDECSGFSVEYIKQAVKLRLSDTHKQQWSAEIAEHSACTYYARIKDEPCLEKYLIELDFRNRCIVAKFRSRSNFLPINHTKLPHVVENDIICPFCDAVCANESHFLLSCPFFDRERNMLDNQICLNENLYNSIDNLSKCTSFMQFIMDECQDILT